MDDRIEASLDQFGALRCALEPIRKVARMVHTHWDGVMNAATIEITNAMSESFNSRIQRIKKRARGFRNRWRFREPIHFSRRAGSLSRHSIQPTRKPDALWLGSDRSTLKHRVFAKTSRGRIWKRICAVIDTIVSHAATCLRHPRLVVSGPIAAAITPR